MKQREKRGDSPPSWNPSKRSETIATTPRNLIEERNLVAISGKEKETTPFKFARLADISDRGNGIQRVAKSRRRWGRNELAGRLIILTAQEFVCVAGHSIILTAANPSRNIVQWTRPLLILSLFLDEWSTTGIKKGRKRGDGRVPKNRLIMESSDPRERWEREGWIRQWSFAWLKSMTIDLLGIRIFLHLPLLYEALLDALPLREFESELFPRSILENFELEIQFLELRIFYIYIKFDLWNKCQTTTG